MAYDGDYLADIDPSDPPGNEAKSFGDDAIREIKRVLTQMFPGSFAATVPDSYGGTLQQLSEAVLGGTFPRNSLIMWYPDPAQEDAFPEGPGGWTICDGRVRKDGSGNTPDLRSSFILGAKSRAVGGSGLDGEVGQQGGNREIQAKVNNQLVNYTTQGTTLTRANLPAHTHNMFTDSTGQGNPSATDTVSYRKSDSSSFDYQMTIGEGAVNRGETDDNDAELKSTAHTHKFTLNSAATGQITDANMPPFYCALYILKD
jgi:hypothetical protein